VSRHSKVLPPPCQSISPSVASTFRWTRSTLLECGGSAPAFAHSTSPPNLSDHRPHRKFVILLARRRREPIRRGPLFGFRWYLPEMGEGPQRKRSTQTLNAPDLLSTGGGSASDLATNQALTRCSIKRPCPNLKILRGKRERSGPYSLPHSSANGRWKITRHASGCGRSVTPRIILG